MPVSPPVRVGGARCRVALTVPETARGGDGTRMSARGDPSAAVVEAEQAMPRSAAPPVAGVPAAAMFRDYGASLRSYFRQRLSDEADCEDAVQDVYVRLLGYCGEQVVRSPQALVFSIARSVLFDRQRRRKSRHADRHVELHAVEMPDPGADQERDACIEQELALLERAIAGLTPKCRRAFLLSRLHNLTYPEIAEQMELSVQMVAKHISNALAACRRQLGAREERR